MKNKNMVVWIIIIAAAIFIIGPKLGLFSIQFIGVNQLDSSFVGKGGITGAISQNYPDSINSIIDNAYGFAIFDGPVKLDGQYKNTLIQSMQRANYEVKTSPDFGPIFNYQEPFSQSLIAVISKSEYTYADLKVMAREIDATADNFCSAARTYSQNHTDDLELVLKICNAKPADLFTESNGKMIWNAWGDIVFENQTIYLSKIKGEFYESKGDIFIAANQKGISELEGIESKYEFPQYAYEINHSQSSSFNTCTSNCYTVISNDADVILASSGDIEKSNSFTDLWYGITHGNSSALKDWKLWGIVGGILVFLFIILKR